MKKTILLTGLVAILGLASCTGGSTTSEATGADSTAVSTDSTKVDSTKVSVDTTKAAADTTKK
jgi:hypothetical protein